MSTTRKHLALSWTAQIIAAAVLLETLFFKFTASEESVYIFSRLGVEPWGRIGAGIAELVAATLLLIPRTAAVGAALAVAIIGGAIMSHLTVLGIVIQDDGGLLFGLAVTVLVASMIVLFIRRAELPFIGCRFFARGECCSCATKSCSAT